MTGSIARAASEALALLFPVSCAACGEPGRALCDACRDAITPHATRVAVGPATDPLVVCASLDLEGRAGDAVRALKQDGRVDLVRPLGRALRPALVAAARGERSVLAVAVPSGRPATIRRGYRVVERLIRAAGVRPVRGMGWSRTARDQRGLGREARARNLEGALVAGRVPRGARIVLVDDVVTTGATLLEARRAMREAGVIVCGAVALARTPRRWEVNGR